MKSKGLKVLSLVLATVFLASIFATSAPAAETVFNVSNSAELDNAKSTISTSGAGDYVISLQGDISGSDFAISGTGVNVTVIGNGHSVTFAGEQRFDVSDGASLTLGDGNSTLNVIGGVSNDAPGTVHVYGPTSSCTMNEGVTIRGSKGNNYYGGGVTVDGGTFIMEGGTITDCGIEGGSVCYGGGVAVSYGGLFVMNGGTISDCYAKSDYIDYYDPNRCFAAVGGGVFATYGSSFIMNGGTIDGCEATNFGGGVAVMNSNNEVNSYGYGYLKSAVTINDGTISNNKAGDGAGVFASAYFYIFMTPVATSMPAPGVPATPGLLINGGEITGNEADGMGGGVLIAMLRPTVSAKIGEAVISGNTADSGAGVQNYGYWTQLTIDGATITNNAADSNGGGVCTNANSSGGSVTIANSTITGNTSGEIGAGVYYDANSRLNIKGNDVIQNNTYNGSANNLNVLSLSKPVYVTGALTGSQIGLSDPTLWGDALPDVDPSAVSTDYLTSGFTANNPGNTIADFFTSDHAGWLVDRSDVNTDEIRLVRQVYEYIDSINLAKHYKVGSGYDSAGSDVTTAGTLEENVTFTITPYASYNRETGKTDIPAFASSSYTISAGDGTDNVDVALPDFSAANYGIGDYWYKVTETAGSTAGVGYDTTEYYLHLVVSYEDPFDPTSFGVSQTALHKAAPAADGSYVNDTSDKTDGFTNTYSAGSLTVSKELTGNLADRDKTFSVTVTFTAPAGKMVSGDISYGASGTIAGGWTGSQSVTLTLTKDSSVTFTNVPDGVTYTVAEADYSAEGYDIPVYAFDNASEAGDTVATAATWSGNSASGTISDSADTVTVTNNKTAPIDVGVILDNAPFITLIALVTAASVFMVIRRRRNLSED